MILYRKTKKEGNNNEKVCSTVWSYYLRICIDVRHLCHEPALCLLDSPAGGASWSQEVSQFLMMKRWCTNIASKLSENNCFPKTEIEVYAYGLQFGLEMLINILTTLTIGFFLGMLWESILLFAGYMFLRSYAGGYHSETFAQCYIMSNLLVATILVLCRVIPDEYGFIVSIILTCISFPIVFLLVPVQTPNKPLDAYEVAHHRRQSQIRLIIETVVIVALLVTGLGKLALLISLGLASICILMLIGAIRNRIYPIQGGQ